MTDKLEFEKELCVQCKEFLKYRKYVLGDLANTSCNLSNNVENKIKKDYLRIQNSCKLHISGV